MYLAFLAAEGIAIRVILSAFARKAFIWLPMCSRRNLFGCLCVFMRKAAKGCERIPRTDDLLGG